MVSLGPYHRGRPSLDEMNRHKWRALHHFLNRTGQDVGLYLHAVRYLEDSARGFYEASLDISSEDFVKTLVLDSIFLLEIFLGAADDKFQADYDPHDPVFSIHNNTYSLQPDMLLLENQLPLFILDRILCLHLGRDEPGLFAKLALHFFQPVRLTDETFDSYSSSISENSSSSSEALHCLDLFRRSLLFPNQIPPKALPVAKNLVPFPKQKPPSLQIIHCVDELRKAGIRFQRRRSDQFWDIKFKDGVLQIPRICIQKTTKSLFLNLIAFELCHSDCSNHITSYVIFMDNLINSDVDVKYLHDKGIIKHWLGNDGEVADMFNRLTNNVNFDISNCYLSELSKEVNKYYNRRWNTWKASLIHKHFSNPWTIISLVAAVVLLLLTLAQTIYSICGYYKKPN